MFGSAKDKLAPLANICEGYYRIVARDNLPAADGAFVGLSERVFYRRDEKCHTCRPPKLGVMVRYRTPGPIWQCSCDEVWLAWPVEDQYWHRITPYSCQHFADDLNTMAQLAKNRAISLRHPHILLD